MNHDTYRPSRTNIGSLYSVLRMYTVESKIGTIPWRKEREEKGADCTCWDMLGAMPPCQTRVAYQSALLGWLTGETGCRDRYNRKTARRKWHAAYIVPLIWALVGGVFHACRDEVASSSFTETRARTNGSGNDDWIDFHMSW